MARSKQGKPLDQKGGTPGDEFGVIASTLADPSYGWVVVMKGDEPFEAYRFLGSPTRVGLQEKEAKTLAQMIFQSAREIFQKRQSSPDLDDYHS